MIIENYFDKYEDGKVYRFYDFISMEIFSKLFFNINRYKKLLPYKYQLKIDTITSIDAKSKYVLSLIKDDVLVTVDTDGSKIVLNVMIIDKQNRKFIKIYRRDCLYDIKLGCYVNKYHFCKEGNWTNHIVGVFNELEIDVQDVDKKIQNSVSNENIEIDDDSVYEELSKRFEKK